MERFLSQCAQYILKQHSDELKDICLVFPNRRSGVFFTAYLQNAIEGALIGPKTTTVNELISGRSEWNVADKLQLISILYDVFLRHTKTTETFDEFYFWGEILLADFNDIDRYLVNAKDLFTNISDLKEIDSIFDYLTEEQKKALEQFWGSMTLPGKKEFKEKYIAIWDKLFPVYSDFKEELKARKLAFPGMIDREVAEKLADAEHDFPFKKYYIIGLNALNACEEKIFSFLQKAGKAVFLWDYDRSYLDEKSNEAGYFLRANLKRFPAPDDFELNTDVFASRKKISLVAVSSVNGQAQQIPAFLNDLPPVEKRNFDDTAVVLADESLLFPALGAIPEEIGKVNITMGYPVRNSVVFGFLMLLVALLKNRRKEEGSITAFHRYVTDILNHQLLSDIESERVKSFLSELKKNNRFTVELSELSFSELHGRIFTLPDTTKDYGPYFLSVLGMFYTHNKESEMADPMLLELIYSMYSAIEKLSAVVSTTLEEQIRPISDVVFFRLFSQYLGQVSVAFEGEPLSGLQVMGILETRCLDFENLIILGFNENKWPRKFTAPSFIPYNIRQGFGLPGIDEQDAMYAYYFYRLMQRTNNTAATYSVVKEGIGTGELSRYGFQLQYDSVHKPNMQSLDFVLTNDPAEEISIHSSPATARLLLEKNAEKALSPSAINTYLNCQLKFYLKYVVKIDEPDELKEEIDGVVFGNIFHDTMEELYKPYVGREIGKDLIKKIRSNKAGLENEITRQVARHYLNMKEPFKKPVRLEGATLLIFENIKTYLRQLLKKDMEYAPFTIVSLEGEYQRNINVKGRDLKVGGKIDRIDRKDGITRVIDYKTGRVETLTMNAVEDLFERDMAEPKKVILQALIYTWGLRAGNKNLDIEPAIYGLHSIFNDNFSPVIKLKKDKKEVSFSEIESDFENQLKDLVGEIYSEKTVFKQTVHAKKCSYCAYSAICRKY